MLRSSFFLSQLSLRSELVSSGFARRSGHCAVDDAAFALA
jgi:hypothetical protein